MSISLILIGIISLIVIGGTAYLFLNKNQELTEQKKTTILLIVGAVIFISFLVTTFKHRKIQFNSTTVEKGTLDIASVFFGGNCDFPLTQKWPRVGNLPIQYQQQIFKRNYESLSDITETTDEVKQFISTSQEVIAYLSKKDQGASYFLKELAINVCSVRKTPVVYLKLEEEMINQEEFAKRVGVTSFDQLQKHFCHFSGIQIKQTKYGHQFFKRQGTFNRPYLIIDNFDHLLGALSSIEHYNYRQNTNNEDDDSEYQALQIRKNAHNGKQRLISKIMNQLVGNCGSHLILNTEKETAIEQLYQIWQENAERLKKEKGHAGIMFPFEFHRWEGLKQYDIYKIVSKTIQNGDVHASKILQATKKEKYNFKEFSDILQQIQETRAGERDGRGKTAMRSTKDEQKLRQFNMKLNVAKYFRLDKLYRILKNSENNRLSHLKTKLAFSQLQKLQSIGLVQIKDGSIYLK